MARPFIAIVHGADESRPDEADTVKTAREVGASLSRLGYEPEIFVLGLDLSAIAGIAARRPLAVFNLVEALGGAAALSYLPCPVYEHFGLAYTGAKTQSYFETLSKLRTKARLRAAGLPTAPWWGPGEDVPAGETVIVKSVLEHASLGMDVGSLVPGARATAEMAARTARFGGAFFAERFLPGREFNISVLERRGDLVVLPIPEIDFDGLPKGRPRIIDYEAKWDETSLAYHKTPRVFGLEAREVALAAALAELARKAFALFGLSGYARIDVRLDGAGVPHILEVNANPCLARDAGFAAAALEAGIAYDDVIADILAAAVGAGAMKRPMAQGPAGALLWREEVGPADEARVRRLVRETEMFSPAEVDIAEELVRERIARGPASGYAFIVAESRGEIAGYACYGRTPGTEATYDLYWIVVDAGRQGQGLGRELLARVEAAIRAEGGRRIMVDTSSTERYVPTRAFYDRTGFVEVARLKDFYRDGDSKVIYEKRV